jgi:magnesium chelatase family protein
MVARVRTVAFQGIDVAGVDVQVQMAGGLPAFAIVGLPDKSVAESKERVRGALTAIGLALPGKRIIVNLAPADLAKEGTHFDLPIALGLLIALGALKEDDIAQYVCLGELGLDGSLANVAGVLPAAMFAASRNAGLICPKGQGGEAAWAGELDVLAPAHLIQLINHCKGTQLLSAPKPQLAEEEALYPDLKDIKGQESAKRALEIAAAGNHNLLKLCKIARTPRIGLHSPCI